MASASAATTNVLVLDAASNQPIYAKAADDVTPIASLTKLMTAIVTIDGGQSLDDRICGVQTVHGSRAAGGEQASGR